MKKLRSVAFLLVLLMTATTILVACAPSNANRLPSEVVHTYNLIAAVPGQITAQNRTEFIDALEIAEDAYKALSDAHRELVSNSARLDTARTQLVEFDVSVVMDLITAIPSQVNAGNVVAFEAALDAADAAYAALASNEVRAMVTNSARLGTARTELNQFIADQASVQAVYDLIALMPSQITDANRNAFETALNNAQDAYDALDNATLRSMVENRARLAESASIVVFDLVADIPASINLGNRFVFQDAVVAAEDGYAALANNTLRAVVGNSARIAEARTELDAFNLANPTDEQRIAHVDGLIAAIPSQITSANRTQFENALTVAQDAYNLLPSTLQSEVTGTARFAETASIVVFDLVVDIPSTIDRFNRNAFGTALVAAEDAYAALANNALRNVIENSARIQEARTQLDAFDLANPLHQVTITVPGTGLDLFTVIGDSETTLETAFVAGTHQVINGTELIITWEVTAEWNAIVRIDGVVRTGGTVTITVAGATDIVVTTGQMHSITAINEFGGGAAGGVREFNVQRRVGNANQALWNPNNVHGVVTRAGESAHGSSLRINARAENNWDVQVWKNGVLLHTFGTGASQNFDVHNIDADATITAVPTRRVNVQAPTAAFEYFSATATFNDVTTPLNFGTGTTRNDVRNGTVLTVSWRANPNYTVTIAPAGTNSYDDQTSTHTRVINVTGNINLNLSSQRMIRVLRAGEGANQAERDTTASVLPTWNWNTVAGAGDFTVSYYFNGTPFSVVVPSTETTFSVNSGAGEITNLVVSTEVDGITRTSVPAPAFTVTSEMIAQLAQVEYLVNMLDAAFANMSNHRGVQIDSSGTTQVRGTFLGLGNFTMPVGATAIMNFDDQGNQTEFYRYAWSRNTGGTTQDAATVIKRTYHSYDSNNVYIERRNNRAAVSAGPAFTPNWTGSTFNARSLEWFAQNYQRCPMSSFFYIVNSSTIASLHQDSTLVYDAELGDYVHQFAFNLNGAAWATTRHEVTRMGGLNDARMFVHQSSGYSCMLRLTFRICQDGILRGFDSHARYRAFDGGLGDNIDTEVITTFRITYFGANVFIPWAGPSA